MKNLVNFALAGCLAVSLSGCIIVGDRDNHEEWRLEQRENRETISELELGTSRDRVLTLMGAPAFSEAFTRNGNDYQVLYYRTQHRHSDGDTTKDETTPLVFKNDRLAGWGEEALAEL